MKTFKQYLNEEVPNIPEPIHFKSGQTSNRSLFEGKDSGAWRKKNDNNGVNNDDLSISLSSHHNLTPDHIKHIHKYTRSSVNLNRNLLKDSGEYIDPEHRDQVKHIDDAIKKHPLPHDLHVYSGLGFDPTKHINDKGKMKSPAYISATHSKSMATDFASHFDKNTGEKVVSFTDMKDRIIHVAHIHLKKGAKAIHVEGVSYNDGEHETILARNTILKHHGHTDYPTNTPLAPTIRVHKMSVVSR